MKLRAFSFQVTHADTQLVSSQTKTANLNIEVGNTLLETESHYYTSFYVEIHTETLQL